MMELTYLNFHHVFCFFYVTINNIKTDNTKYFYFRAEHSDFIKYLFNKLGSIIQITSIFFSMPYKGKYYETTEYWGKKNDWICCQKFRINV